MDGVERLHRGGLCRGRLCLGSGDLGIGLGVLLVTRAGGKDLHVLRWEFLDQVPEQDLGVGPLEAGGRGVELVLLALEWLGSVVGLEWWF